MQSALGLESRTRDGFAVRAVLPYWIDRLFYAPWVALNDTETDELRGLLARLRDGARALAEQNTG